VIARFPCLATGTPQAATISAAVVEMLNVPEPSPPVPTTSIVPSGASTRTTRSRIADAKPASSSTVSPRIRSPISSAASCEGVASPSMTAPMAARASARESVPPSMTAARAARTASLIGSSPSRGRWRPHPRPWQAWRRHRPTAGRPSPPPPIRRARGWRTTRPPRRAARRRLRRRGAGSWPAGAAPGREDRSGWNGPLHRQGGVADPHEDVVPALWAVGPSSAECGRVDAEGVVAGGHEGRRHPGQQPRAVVVHGRGLAVDERGRADDRGAERGTHGLHAEQTPGTGSVAEQRSGRHRSRSRRAPGPTARARRRSPAGPRGSSERRSRPRRSRRCERRAPPPPRPPALDQVEGEAVVLSMTRIIRRPRVVGEARRRSRVLGRPRGRRSGAGGRGLPPRQGRSPDAWPLPCAPSPRTRGRIAGATIPAPAWSGRPAPQDRGCGRDRRVEIPVVASSRRGRHRARAAAFGAAISCIARTLGAPGSVPGEDAAQRVQRVGAGGQLASTWLTRWRTWL